MAYSSSAALIIGIIALIIAIIALVFVILIMMRKTTTKYNVITGGINDTAVNGVGGNYYISPNISNISVNSPGGNPTGQMFIISNQANSNTLVLAAGSMGMTITGSNTIAPGAISQFVWTSSLALQNITNG